MVVKCVNKVRKRFFLNTNLPYFCILDILDYNLFHLIIVEEKTVLLK